MTLKMCIAFCLFACVSAESCKAVRIKKEHLNKRLTGHKITELMVKGHHECVRECFYLSVCKSTDYYKGECKLNDADSKSAETTEFENKPGAVYSDITEWPSEMAGVCGQRPCSEKQKCFPDKDGFHCVSLVTDCKDMHRYFPSLPSGVYEVELWRSFHSLHVYCDMDTEGGGWTVFQSRFDGSVDFYQNSLEYENGFGNLETEFWLGLKYVWEMASQGQTELRIDLTAADGTDVYETFQNFYLDKGPEYTLHIDPGTGTAGDDVSLFGLSYHNGQHFSTYDADRDSYPENCASIEHGGWWYNACGGANLNGEYVLPGTVHPSGYWVGMIYQQFKGYETLKTTKMMFRRV